MKLAQRPANEASRIAALQSLALLDTPPEPAFDEIVKLAGSLFEAPISLVSLVDSQRQWFKAVNGLDVAETARDISFCGHAILGDDVLVVPDAQGDPRFNDNPLVLGPPFIRFYAGAPIRLADGHAIGTVCVVDHQPRPDFSQRDAERLASIAAICVQVIASRAEAAQNARVLAQLPMGVLLRTEAGVLIDVNPAFAEMLRRPKESLRGLHLGDIRVPEPSQGEHPFLVRTTPGESRTYEVELLRSDGAHVPVQIRELHVDRGLESMLICVVENMTERKREAYHLAQAQKMEAIGQLTGGLAHDFNNMLGVIIGNLDLMEREFLGRPGAKSKLETARTAALRGADLTRALLSVARRQTLAPEPVELNARLTELVPLIQHTMGAAIQVVVDLDDSPMVNVDSSGLAGAILNLAINARDAMPNGGRLTLRTRLRSILYDDQDNEMPPGAYVAMSVSDTGHGMTQDVLARAAQPFFTTKERGCGTGLGLAMAKGFAKQSRGDFRIYSEVGHGTSVTFLLPLTARAPVQVELEKPLLGGGERLLVVDDELELLAVTATWLKDLGYRVTPCASPRSALAAIMDSLASGDPFNLLVTDVIMPGINGFELAIESRALLPDLALLYVSGFADAAERTTQRLDGDLIQKPFRQSELASAARRALDERATEKKAMGTKCRR